MLGTWPLQAARQEDDRGARLYLWYTYPAARQQVPSLPSRTTRFARHVDERNVGCVYHQRCSSIKRQTIYIGSVEVVTDPFFLEGVLYTIKLTSHVSISVFPRMIFAWHQKWSGSSRPCLVYCQTDTDLLFRHGYECVSVFKFAFSRLRSFLQMNIPDSILILNLNLILYRMVSIYWFCFSCFARHSKVALMEASCNRAHYSHCCASVIESNWQNPWL